MSEAYRSLCVARLGGTEIVLLWESGDDAPDRIVLDADGFVIAFPSARAARDAASAAGPPLAEDEPTFYDLDAIDAWCRTDAPIRDCAPLLNAWNLLGDLPRSESLYTAANAPLTGVYDKLFHGCNLPSMTPPGEHYVPTWTASETGALKRLLLLGLAELRARMRG